MTGSYIGERVKGVFQDEDTRKRAMERLHLDNAKEVAKTLGRMRGAAQKLGQSLALAASSLDLPEDVQSVLDQMNSGGEPVPFSVIRATLEAELEAPLEELFASFSEAPLGTASLAQAHAATLHSGEEVVVKVLHAGVKDGVEADLLAFKTMLLSGVVIRRDKAELDAVFTEVQERLNEELDYLQEALNIQDFQRMYGADPRVVVPKLHPKFCTDQVLTLDRVHGRSIDDFLETATPEARQRAGVTLAELYYEQTFKHRTLHADPHPGNYLFQDDGTVGLLDFGCVKRFDEFWVGHYARAALGGLESKREVVIQACLDMGSLAAPDETSEALLWGFIDTLSRPFRAESYTIGAHGEETLEKLRPYFRRMVTNRNVVLPPELVFLHRSLGGLYAIERRLVVEGHWGAILRKNAQYAVDRAEGRLPS